MRSGELFAGVGGLGMAVDAVFGSSPAWFAEFDTAPSEVLAYRHPGIPNYGDVTAVDWPTTPRVNILAGGFPCQDVSLAGRRRGMGEGTRSGLWSEFAKAIDEQRPEWVVIENVRGLLSADAASDMEPCSLCVGDNPGHVLRALGAVLGDLAELGFDAEWTGIRASDVGAPHGRFRVFILAWPATNTDRNGLGSVGRISASEPDTDGRRSSDGTREGSESAAPLALLATPRTTDMNGPGAHGTGGMDLRTSVALLPTPTVGNATGGNAQRGGDRADEKLLPGIAVEISEGTAHAASEGRPSEVLQSVRNAVDADEIRQWATGGSGRVPASEPLLEDVREREESGATGHAPVESESRDSEDGVRTMPVGGEPARSSSGSGRDKQSAREPSGSLQVVPPKAALAGRPGVPGESEGGTDWGPYRTAIERWERVLGRPAPAPVLHDGKGGKARLNAALCEWMMGWPAGHVTDPAIGLSRAEQLKACGNGVVPAQAAAALRELLARPGVPPIRKDAA